MQKRILFLFVAAAAMLASCSTNYKKTKSGLLYKIFSDGKGPVAKRGEVIKLNFRQTLKDSVLQETYTSMPGYALVDSVGPIYNAMELFPELRKGDSLVVVMLGDSILKKFGPQQNIKKDDKITLHFKVLDIMTTEAATADRNNEFTKQKDKQIKAFQDYVAKKAGSAQKTAAGTYVEVKDPGTGEPVQNGKMVSIKYTGKLIPSEKQFESSVYEFVVGAGQAIRGWDDGLLLFKKGGKGTLYVPYELAYGEQQGPGGLPYQSLLFDIEVLDVKDAPAGQGQGLQLPQGLPDTTHGH